MRLRTYFLAALTVLFVSATSPVQSQPRMERTVGVSTSIQYAPQKKTQWCWAASIQMVFSHHGLYLQQKKIVAQTFGTNQFGQAPNWPGGYHQMTSNLNGWGVTSTGKKYVVRASGGFGAPPPKALIRELKSGRPAIIGYKTGPASKHAVVTGISYVSTYRGPMVTKIEVLDPWPSKQNRLRRGRVSYSGKHLAQNITAYWFVRVKSQKKICQNKCSLKRDNCMHRARIRKENCSFSKQTSLRWCRKKYREQQRECDRKTNRCMARCMNP